MSAWNPPKVRHGHFASHGSLEQLQLQDVLRAHFSPLPPPQCHLIKYAVRHSSELLDCAFSDTDSDVSKLAFAFLARCPREVSVALVQSDIFHTKATEVISNPNVALSHVVRFSILFTRLLGQGFTDFPDLIGFLSQFIKFIDDPSVLNLFTTIVTDAHLETLLLQSGFARMLVSEISRNSRTEILVNLASIVSTTLKNAKFLPQFSTPETLSTFCRLTNHPDLVFQNDLWSIICAVSSESTIQHISAVRNVVLNSIQDIESVHIFHVCMFDLLCKFVAWRAAEFSPAEKMVIVAAAVDLIQRFDNNTNLMHSVFRLVRAMLRSGQFVMFAMPCLFPIIMVAAQSPNRTAAAALSLGFLVDVQESRGKRKCLDQYLRGSVQFTAFEQGFLKGHLRQRKESYGGPVLTLGKRNSATEVEKITQTDTKRIISDFIAN
jgi:hypothetical protein